LPYLVHVSSVAMEVIAALQAEPGHDDDLAVTAAPLYDVVEDTSTTVEVVAAALGPRAAGVSALTESAALDKPAAMTDTLARILKQPLEIAIVKLGDRVINLAPPPPRWSAPKVAAYRAEAQTILDALGAASPFLSARLAERSRTYPPEPPGRSAS
jgi:(p)ppGpp synthase/HD superfamily hydrolase